MRLGYVGLGNIGNGMATNLAKAGFSLQVYDLRPEALERAVGAGASAAGSLKEIIESCDIILLCLTYDEQIRDAIFGKGGIVECGRPGQTVIIHSTILPETVRECADAARKAGIVVIDAPVSGAGWIAADAGTLTIMVGAPRETFDRCRPIFEAMGNKIYHVGEVGAGEVMKLTNNAMAHCNRLVYLEALQIAEAFGISEEQVNEVVTTSTGMSFSQVNHDRPDNHIKKHTLAGSKEMPFRFSKDLRYATGISLQKLLSTPMIALGSQLAPDVYAKRWQRILDRADGKEQASAPAKSTGAPQAGKGDRPRLGYVGLGDMGRGMAINMAKAGFPLKVYDLRPEALVEAVEAGATAARDLREVVEFADIIHLCLVYDQQILDIVTGEDGIIAHGRPGQIIVVHSTLLPATVQRCAEAARAAGLDLVDAAVSGGKPGSYAGTLTLMVGGSPEAVERSRPGMSATGTVYCVGEAGAGQAMKLTNNVMGICNRIVYLEALQIAESYGISEATMNEIVSDSTGMSYAQVHHRRTDLRNEDHTLAGSTEFPYRLSKDLRYAVQVGLGLLIPMPIAALASQIAPESYSRRWARIAQERKAEKAALASA